MSGGPDDGVDLYPDDHEPCLVCGRLIGVDWDGVLVWHYQGPANGLLQWCPGSRTSWSVLA